MVILLIIVLANIFLLQKEITCKNMIRNSLLMIWDIYCKNNIMEYLNTNNVSYKLIEISDIGYIFIINTNYYCFMSKHPQEYNNLSILINEIITVIKNNNLKSIVSFSTAGSKQYQIGTIVQFGSAIIDDPESYSLQFNKIKPDNILYKTIKYTDESITDTKGFILNSEGQIASGQDEFVVYMVSNQMKIPVLTLTGISDNDNIEEYNNGGGKIASKNIVDFFFNTFQVI